MASSLLLEFVALVVCASASPDLARPFKAGNLAFACLLGVGPAALIGYALYASRAEKLMGTTSALLFCGRGGLARPGALLDLRPLHWRGATSVLDPQGQTIQNALRKIGFADVTAVRQGKYFALSLADGLSAEAARSQVERIAREVLTNPVIEEFTYRIEE
jgi:phosphoribosylformylglycinamidine synthase PurS subunit